MPTNLDFALYFNIAFFSMLGIGLLVGFAKGLKNAMWGFVVTLIFYGFFFLTLDTVINTLWSFNMPFLGGLLANVSSDLSGVTQLSQALPILLNQFLGDMLGSAVDNVHLLEFATSLALFVLKVVYMILYFTVIQVLYRLILWIVKLIIFPSKKKTDKYRSKNRGLGAVFGLLSGAMSLYVSLIIFGGLLSIADSLVSVMPQNTPTQMNQIVYTQEFDAPTSSLILTGSILDNALTPEVEDAVSMITEAVDSFNSNIIVTTQNQITMTSEYTGEQMALNLYLFDEVLSMNYQDEQIAFRAEIEIFADAAGVVLNSPYLDSQNLSDITGDDIRDVFSALSDSNLFTNLIPLAVEIGYEKFEVANLDINMDDIYNIDWDIEIMQLGEIAAQTFDIINAAGILVDGVDMATVQLDGDAVSDLFDAISESQIVNLAAYIALEPLMEEQLASIAPYVTVPDDIVWEDEFQAIGAFAGAVLNTDLSYGDISEQNVTNILTALADIDFELLLDSKIITSAMINILSGSTPTDVSFLNVPDGIEWYDTVVDGVTVYGELHNILIAVNALADSLSTLDITDFAEFGISDLASLDLTTINSIFESKILVATITDYVLNLDLGEDYTIIIPDSAMEDGYLRKTELQNIVTAVSMLLDNLACDIGDTECEAIGFDFMKVLTLSEANIVTLLTPDILAATVGNILYEMGTSTGTEATTLTIPGSALSTIYVDTVAQQVVSRDEIRYAFLAISTLGITDINDVSVDASILTNLGTEADPTVLDTTKSATLFASNILKATITQYLMSVTDEGSDTSVVIVPYEDPDGVSIRQIDSVDGVTVMITETELSNILAGVLALDIQDFTTLDTINLNDILDNVSTLLNSAILHATVSDMLLGMDDVVVIPTHDLEGNAIRITTGPVDHETTYIAKLELENAIKALQVLEISDINNVSIDVTILNNLGTEADPTILDDAKKTDLFASTIINATLSKYILDLTAADDPFIIVPYKDQDDTIVRETSAYDSTEFISEEELTNLLQAVLVLNLQDFDSMSTLDLTTLFDNIDTLLDSSILHASISKQLLELTDVVTIPMNKQDTTPLRITTDLNGNTNEFIDRTELIATIDALNVLGINDIENVTIDVSILNNLGTDADPTVLDTTKSDTLFASSILCATLSHYIIDIAEPVDPLADPFMVVPFIGLDASNAEWTVRTVDVADGTEYIHKDELTNVFRAILKLELQDFDSVESFSLETIIANSDVLLDSVIFHATISKQLSDLGSELITIPQNKQNGDPLKITTTDGTHSTEFIDRVELEATLDALDVLEMLDISSVSVDVGILTRLATADDATVLDTTKSDTLFASSIMTATISKFMIDFNSDADPLIFVPQTTETGDAVRNVDLADGTEYITQTELTNVLKAILALDISNFDAVESLSMTTIIDNRVVLLDSAIMQATISKQIIDLSGDAIVIPEQEEDDSTYVLIAAEANIGQAIQYIARDQIDALLDVLVVLEITDINSFSGTIDLTLLNKVGAIDTMVASAIIQATISKQIFDVVDDPLATTDLIVPYQTDDESAPVDLRITAGDTVLTELIKASEIKDLLEAFVAMDMTSIDSIGDSISLTKLADNAVTVFESYIIQATVSSQILNISAVITPSLEDDDLTPVKTTTGILGNMTDFISKAELKEFVEAATVFVTAEGGSVDDFDGSMDLSILNDPVKRTTLLESSIMQATMSDQIFNMGGDLRIPVRDVNDVLVHVTTTDLDEYLTLDEINHLLDALSVLGILGDLANYNGQVSIGDLFESVDPTNYDTNRSTLLSSAIMHATVTDQIQSLDPGVGTRTVIIPINGMSAEAVKLYTAVSLDYYIDKTEISHLLDALDLLGFSGDISTFGGTLDISSLDSDTKRTTVLSSAIVHATISKQLLDLSDDVLIVPMYTEDGEIAANLLQQTPDVETFIIKNEIKAILEAFTEMGYGNLTSGMPSSLDSTKFFENPNLYLASSSIQATLSQKLFDINDSETIMIFPDYDIRTIPDTQLVIEQTDVTYILKAELLLLLAAMDEMDLTNFDTVSITPTSMQNKDYTIITDSAIMQATISNKILAGATDETAPVSGKLIVPTYFYEVIQVETVNNNWIERTELVHLMAAFSEFGLTSFDSIDASSFNTLTGTQIDTITTSGSMHTTIDYMLQSNANISASIPALAMDTYLYVGYSMVTPDEIRSFILATNVVAGPGDSITNITFDVSVITGLNASERDIVLDSMIVRNMLTDELETMMLADDPFDTYWPANSDYENSDPLTFLTEAGINNVLAHYSL